MITKKCVICGIEFDAKSSKAMYCSQDCKFKAKYKKDAEKALNKRGGIKKCIVCNTEFIPPKPSSKCCSDACKNIFKKQKDYNNKINENNLYFKNKEEIKDYVVCKICGLKSEHLHESHFKFVHNITSDDYLLKYPNSLSMCENKINAFSGENNINHTINTSEEERKERSPFSDNFYIKRNIDLSNKDNLIKDIHSDMLYNTQIEFYVNKGYTQEEAKILLSKRQCTFSKNKCIELYGEEDGIKIWNNRQIKWLNSFYINYKNGKFCNTSKIFETLLNEIKLNKSKYLFGCNEFKLGKYLFDLTNIETKRCIEFNGDYWHCNPNKYDKDYFHVFKNKYAHEIWEYDKNKILYANDNGFEVMTIWESEYKNNKEYIIDKCKEFIL